MKIKEIRKKSSKQLQEALKESKEKVRDLRFKQASRQLKDVRILRKTKREVAKIMTILNQESPKSFATGQARIKNQAEKDIKTSV